MTIRNCRHVSGAEFPVALLAGDAVTHAPSAGHSGHRQPGRRVRLHPVHGHLGRTHAHSATGAS